MEPVDAGRHPLLREFRPKVATPAIIALADAIHRALDLQSRGLNLRGFAQYGKSSAISYLRGHAHWLTKRNRSAVIRTIVIPNVTRKSDRTFPQLLLSLLGVRIPGRASPTELGILFANSIVAFCHEAGTRLAILFHDDANRLQPSDYDFLAWADEILATRRYRLFHVFVHQQDVSGLATETIAADYPPHVSARFRLSWMDFFGMRHAADVAYVCNRFDTKSFWPVKSGVSYTQHFTREAFERGFRLQTYASELWEAAAEVRAEGSLDPTWTWSMRSLEATLIVLLTQTAARDPQFTDFTREQLKAAVRESQLVELERQRTDYRTPGASEGSSP
ncbi:hypothetical protein DFR29_121109 [Tahibacter aquaticus]|uniref:AAA domain-containing protein n=1 Tax=Tahibacter aquaticus TaxID=520092 RepID=A0A4R6YM74_9GAMM|nr:hypothetical protein [Tahibacter aquaticus]TDR38437.1 hypothetical protein DFR29_121109 [Tahibacter aquaticus]